MNQRLAILALDLHWQQPWGYKMIIVMPEKMSMEKVALGLGCQNYQNTDEAGHDDPEGLFHVSRKLKESTPNIYLDQYGNSAAEAHEEGTAIEIWNDFSGKIDMIVVGVGTGGYTGIAKYFKKRNLILMVEGPYGSVRRWR